jgi:lysophospholipid acyltransferase (LPLAT)-like uncharacterized protein
MPLPFSKNVVAYGEPFSIGSDLSDEEAARQIARALDATTQEADEKWGQR